MTLALQVLAFVLLAFALAFSIAGRRTGEVFR